MEKQNVNMYYKLCRLCLEVTGAVNMFEIEGLKEDIFTCTSIKVAHREQLPPKICIKCLEIIYSANNLRLIARKNDIHLRSLFGDNDEELIKPSENTKDLDLSNSCSISSVIVKSEYFEYEASDTDVEPENKNKRKYSTDSGKNSTNTNTSTIAVRTDLFESSTVSSSTTSENLSSTKGSRKGHKKPKLCDDDLTEYECGTCKKSFETWKKLYLHNRLHTKNVICPLEACGKKFATKGDLQKHTRTHTGEKPYRCEVCDKSFSQRVSLKSHREAVHDMEDLKMEK